MDPGGAEFAAKWQVKQIRGTVFTLLASDVADRVHWWGEALEEKPEEESSRPREGILRQWTTVRGARLTLQSQPERADWLLEHPPEDEGAIGASGCEFFFDTVSKWLTVCPPVHRVAMGAILHRPVPDHGAGYADLAKFLSTVTIDPENSSDFAYQINRPRQAMLEPEIRINRVSKWAVTRLEKIVGAIDIDVSAPQRASVGSLSLQGSAEFNTTLELDINTATSQDEIPHDQLQDLFRELISVGNEIADQGDIP